MIIHVEQNVYRVSFLLVITWKKKGVKFRIKDILLLDTFFNSLQKYFIKYMVFTPKDKIIKRLMITGA